jgi:hypothetical protein
VTVWAPRLIVGGSITTDGAGVAAAAVGAAESGVRGRAGQTGTQARRAHGRKPRHRMARGGAWVDVGQMCRQLHFRTNV